MADQYKALAAMAPEGKLQLIVDSENRGDLHLSLIAEELDEDVLADTLCPRWGIKTCHVKDIKKKYRENLQGMRMELLRKWLNTAGLRATYENLVKDLLDIGESTAARAIVQLWKEPVSPTVPAPEPVQKEPAQPSARGRPAIRKSVGIIKYMEGGQKKKFNLEERVSSKWREMGIGMSIELNTLDNIEDDKGKVSKCWQEIMKRWMDGEGESSGYPATWEGLYELLGDMGVSQVARELMKAVDNYSV